jgi:hypothetical protein
MFWLSGVVCFLRFVVSTSDTPISTLRLPILPCPSILPYTIAGPVEGGFFLFPPRKSIIVLSLVAVPSELDRLVCLSLCCFPRLTLRLRP